MSEGLVSVLAALKNSDPEEAKKKIDEITRDVKTDRERGVMAAAHGIATSMSKGREGTLQSWDPEKVKRAAGRISRSQMSDDYDKGFAETLVEYAQLISVKE
ncbi:MAG TPA: hypothetical protein VEJ36_05760 [Nitrososphaerales archaeon]|nr:hypothetical protein [Nitrososphaerales archaeon]